MCTTDGTERRERPGELLHVDVEKVARIPEGGGRRANGRAGRPRAGAGTACLHVAVDDFGRVAHAEPLPDEHKGTCSGFMARCLALFGGLGVAVERVMTDDGPGYRSGDLDALLGRCGIRHVHTRPCSPWQNGKVERMNRTLAQEWRYGRAWECEGARAAARTSPMPARPNTRTPLSHRQRGARGCGPPGRSRRRFRGGLPEMRGRGPSRRALPKPLPGCFFTHEASHGRWTWAGVAHGASHGWKSAHWVPEGLGGGTGTLGPPRGGSAPGERGRRGDPEAPPLGPGGRGLGLAPGPRTARRPGGR